MYKTITTAIGMSLISVLALGCGGSGSDTATAQVTKAQFIKQGNDICAATTSKIKVEAAAWEKAHAGEELDWNPGLKQILGPLLKQEAAALGALTVPELLEQRVARMIENLFNGAANFVKDGANASPSAIKHFQSEAIQLGLKNCNF